MQLSDVVRIALIFSEDAKRYAKKLAGSIDLSGKADKKKPAAAGNLAALDAGGNLADSGKVLQQPCRESVIRERRKIKKFFNFLQAGLMTMEQILTSYMSWRGSLIKKQARRSVHCTDLLFYKLYGIMPWKIKSKRKSKARHIQWKNLLNASTPSMLKSPPLKAC